MYCIQSYLGVVAQWTCVSNPIRLCSATPDNSRLMIRNTINTLMISIFDKSRHALEVVGVDSKTGLLGGARKVEGLNILSLTGRIER